MDELDRLLGLVWDGAMDGSQAHCECAIKIISLKMELVR